MNLSGIATMSRMKSGLIFPMSAATFLSAFDIRLVR